MKRYTTFRKLIQGLPRELIAYNYGRFIAAEILLLFNEPDAAEWFSATKDGRFNMQLTLCVFVNLLLDTWFAPAGSYQQEPFFFLVIRKMPRVSVVLP